MSSLALLDKNKHADVHLNPITDFKHVEFQHMAPVVVHEFPNAAAEFPIVFIKHENTGEYQPVVMLGLKSKQNLYAGKSQWPGIYVPAAITHYPLALVPSQEDENKLLVAIVEDSDLVSKESGQRLFNEDGTESEALAKRKEALVTQFEYTQITRAFCKTLAELDLFKAQDFTLETNGEKRNITGINMIDEKKLNELSDEQFADLRKRGFLGPIFTQLGSMHQMHRLIAKSMEAEKATAEA
ncbi:SapC family protein [Paraferrimonas sp. SM1919]|uniref:SapC family protein n=1 Tax=Paraferrimonas sp. SM1919 TaxID=2662263 RepID=UPI0013CFA4D1|nr:SapC family protein [Paraferrimonas sp. SM1919]